MNTAIAWRDCMQTEFTPVVLVSWIQKLIFIRGILIQMGPRAWFKGALDNFSLIPRVFFFFFQKSWDFYIIRSVYLCNDWMLNLTCNFNLIKKTWIFLAAVISKSLLLKMTATVMTLEFGTIHHYSSLEENFEACLCSSFNRYKN